MSAHPDPLLEQTFYGQPIYPMAGAAIDAPPDQAEPEFTTDSNDPLVSLGLVDPKTGVALPTQDWQPDSDSDTPSSGTAPTAGTSGSASSPTPNWDAPENPYKAEAERLKAGPDPVTAGQNYLRDQQAKINLDAANAYNVLVNDQKMDPGQAQVLVRSAAQAALTQASKDAEHIALGPTVRRQVAEDIARKFSTDGAKIDPQQLLHLNGPDAMEAVAYTLQTQARDSRAKVRSASGTGRKATDSAEGGAPSGVQFDYSKLSPQQAISLGLRRGQ